MKVTVNRELKNGLYSVRFAVSDFTPDELQKMQSFGIPVIQVKLNVAPAGVRNAQIGITQFNANIVASFALEDEANKYQEEIVQQLRNAMAALRGRKDDFTSTQEVNI